MDIENQSNFQNQVEYMTRRCDEHGADASFAIDIYKRTGFEVLNKEVQSIMADIYSRFSPEEIESFSDKYFASWEQYNERWSDLNGVTKPRQAALVMTAFDLPITYGAINRDFTYRFVKYVRNYEQELKDSNVEYDEAKLIKYFRDNLKGLVEFLNPFEEGYKDYYNGILINFFSLGDIEKTKEFFDVDNKEIHPEGIMSKLYYWGIRTGEEVDALLDIKKSYPEIYNMLIETDNLQEFNSVLKKDRYDNLNGITEIMDYIKLAKEINWNREPDNMLRNISSLASCVQAIAPRVNDLNKLSDIELDSLKAIRDSNINLRYISNPFYKNMLWFNDQYQPLAKALTVEELNQVKDICDNLSSYSNDSRVYRFYALSGIIPDKALAERLSDKYNEFKNDEYTVLLDDRFKQLNANQVDMSTLSKAITTLHLFADDDLYNSFLEYRDKCPETYKLLIRDLIGKDYFDLENTKIILAIAPILEESHAFDNYNDMQDVGKSLNTLANKLVFENDSLQLTDISEAILKEYLNLAKTSNLDNANDALAVFYINYDYITDVSDVSASVFANYNHDDYFNISAHEVVIDSDFYHAYLAFHFTPDNPPSPAFLERLHDLFSKNPNGSGIQYSPIPFNDKIWEYAKNSEWGKNRSDLYLYERCYQLGLFDKGHVITADEEKFLNNFPVDEDYYFKKYCKIAYAIYKQTGEIITDTKVLDIPCQDDTRSNHRYEYRVDEPLFTDGGVRFYNSYEGNRLTPTELSFNKSDWEEFIKDPYWASHKDLAITLCLMTGTLGEDSEYVRTSLRFMDLCKKADGYFPEHDYNADELVAMYYVYKYSDVFIANPYIAGTLVNLHKDEYGAISRFSMDKWDEIKNLYSNKDEMDKEHFLFNIALSAGILYNDNPLTDIEKSFLAVTINEPAFANHEDIYAQLTPEQIETAFLVYQQSTTIIRDDAFLDLLSDINSENDTDIIKFNRDTWYKLSRDPIWDYKDGKADLYKACCALGAFEDDKEISEKAIRYLKNLSVMPSKGEIVVVDKDYKDLQNDFPALKFAKGEDATTMSLDTDGEEELYDEIDDDETRAILFKYGIRDVDEFSMIYQLTPADLEDIDYPVAKKFMKDLANIVYHDVEYEVHYKYEIDQSAFKNMNRAEKNEMVKKFVQPNKELIDTIRAGFTHTTFSSLKPIFNKELADYVILKTPEIEKDVIKQKLVASLQSNWQRILQGIELDKRDLITGRNIPFAKMVAYMSDNAYEELDYLPKETYQDFLRYCSMNKYTISEAKTLLDIYDTQLKREVSSIPPISGKHRGFSYQMLPLHDPAALFFGKYLDCCQELHGPGESCMIHSCTSENGRVFVVKNEEDKVIGGSWVWRNGKTICFDNVETVREDDNGKKTMQPRVQALLMACYEKAAKELIEVTKDEEIDGKPYGVSRVTVGQSNSDLVLAGLDISDKAPYPIEDVHYISDSRTQLILALDEKLEKLYPNLDPNDKEDLEKLKSLITRQDPDNLNEMTQFIKTGSTHNEEEYDDDEDYYGDEEVDDEDIYPAHMTEEERELLRGVEILVNEIQTKKEFFDKVSKLVKSADEKAAKYMLKETEKYLDDKDPKVAPVIISDKNDSIVALIDLRSGDIKKNIFCDTVTYLKLAPNIDRLSKTIPTIMLNNEEEKPLRNVVDRKFNALSNPEPIKTGFEDIMDIVKEAQDEKAIDNCEIERMIDLFSAQDTNLSDNLKELSKEDAQKSEEDIQEAQNNQYSDDMQN